MEKTELEKLAKELNYYPLNHGIIVLVPQVSETTETGIIKSESMLKSEELNPNNAFLEVIAIDETSELIKASKITIGCKVLTRNMTILPITAIPGYKICQTDVYKVSGYRN
jgi:hypothetical protein